jgi:hypothetical protein
MAKVQRNVSNIQHEEKKYTPTQCIVTDETLGPLMERNIITITWVNIEISIIQNTMHSFSISLQNNTL